jgi:hypothetical protein
VVRMGDGDKVAIAIIAIGDLGLASGDGGV